MGGLWVGAIGAATSNATTREIHEACARLRSAMGLIDIIVFNERQKRAWRRFGGVRQGYRRVGPSLDSPLRWRRGGLNEFWLSGGLLPHAFVRCAATGAPHWREYNGWRPYQGRRCFGKTPMQTGRRRWLDNHVRVGGCSAKNRSRLTPSIAKLERTSKATYGTSKMALSAKARAFL
jgi:hypothetical protein